MILYQSDIAIKTTIGYDVLEDVCSCSCRNNFDLEVGPVPSRGQFGKRDFKNLDGRDPGISREYAKVSTYRYLYVI